MSDALGRKGKKNKEPTMSMKVGLSKRYPNQALNTHRGFELSTVIDVTLTCILKAIEFPNPNKRQKRSNYKWWSLWRCGFINAQTWLSSFFFLKNCICTFIAMELKRLQQRNTWILCHLSLQWHSNKKDLIPFRCCYLAKYNQNATFML